MESVPQSCGDASAVATPAPGSSSLPEASASAAAVVGCARARQAVDSSLEHAGHKPHLPTSLHQPHLREPHRVAEAAKYGAASVDLLELSSEGRLAQFGLH